MGKVQRGPATLIYPMPALLVGAMVKGKPNFMTVAWGGICNAEPPMITVSIRHERYTNAGIKQSQAFSVNVPSVDLVKETDYCGSVTGAKVDKAAVCKFTVFYGKLAGAPLIEQCPVNLECQVEHILNLGSHDLIVGKILETHVSEECLTNGEPDVEKIKPFAYITRPIAQYQAMGDVLGKAFSIGQTLRKK